MQTTPDTLLESAVDRLSRIGASPADQRDALAVLALIAAGLDPARFAGGGNVEAVSGQLGLDPAEWPRITRLLESAGLVTRPRRSGRRGIAR